MYESKIPSVSARSIFRRTMQRVCKEFSIIVRNSRSIRMDSKKTFFHSVAHSLHRIVAALDRLSICSSKPGTSPDGTAPNEWPIRTFVAPVSCSKNVRSNRVARITYRGVREIKRYSLLREHLFKQLLLSLDRNRPHVINRSRDSRYPRIGFGNRFVRGSISFGVTTPSRKFNTE